MSSTTRVGFVAGASMLAVTTVSIAGTDIDAQDYKTRISNLERQIAELRGDENAAAEARADEVRGLVADALADADRRSSLLQSGMVAGWQDGFMLGSADGSYTLKFSGQIQARFVASLQDNAADGDDTEYGFEMRRTKLAFHGNIVDKTWKYKVQGAFATTGGAFMLEDAYVEKAMDNMSVRVGQFKPAFIREENISSTRQLAVDRSYSNELYNQGFAQGVQVAWSQDQFKLAAMLTDGLGTANSNYRGTNEFAFTLRADALVEGTWDQFNDYTSKRGSNYGVRVGAGLSYEKDRFGTVTAGEVETMGFTVDTQAEGDGWNAAASLTYVEGDNNTVDGDALFAVVQGGYYFTDDTEGFVRWSYSDLDDASGLVTGGITDVSVITAGVNHYLAGHSAKLTLDLVYGLDTIPGSNAGIGLGADGANEDGQMALRAQMQLLF